MAVLTPRNAGGGLALLPCSIVRDDLDEAVTEEGPLRCGHLRAMSATGRLPLTGMALQAPHRPDAAAGGESTPSCSRTWNGELADRTTTRERSGLSVEQGSPEDRARASALLQQLTSGRTDGARRRRSRRSIGSAQEDGSIPRCRRRGAGQPRSATACRRRSGRDKPVDSP